MRKLILFLFILFSITASAQVYDSAGYVKVKPVIVTVVKKDTVFIAVPVIVRDTITIYKDTCPVKPPVDTITPPPLGYIQTFQSGYDQMSDMTYGGNGQYGNGTISTTTYKTGPGSFYSRPQNVSSGIRSEVQYTGTAQNPSEGSVEYDVRYEVIIPNNGHSFQWHPNTSGGSASPGLWHEGGRFTWYNWKEGGNYVIKKQFFSIPTNKWMHFRIEYKFGSNGYLRHWIDGVQVVNYTGQVGDNSGFFIKVGYNGWDANSANSRIYYDNLIIYKKQ